MNDFREYSAAFMDHQNDLAHFGVKGMKWRRHLSRFQEITGFGVKKEEKRIRRAGLSLAKNEVGIRRDAVNNNPSLKRDAWWIDRNGNKRTGTIKDLIVDRADGVKENRVGAINEANRLKDVYDKSLLGKLEKNSNKFKDRLKSLRKKKRKSSK